MGRDRRVVITGLGTLAPNGSTTEEYWDSLINGKTGIGRIEKFETSDFRVHIGAEIKDFAPENYDMDRKFVRRADLFTQYSIAASFMAIADAGLDSKDAADPERIGVVYGSGIGGIQTFEVQHTALMNGGPRKISPFFIPMMIADMTSGQISIRFGAKGPNYTTVTACASASHGIGNAAREIRDDEADVMITGGAEAAVTPMSLGGFAALHALSTRNDEPERASRPFDAERDGFVIGEGAGSLILEELEHAKKRGARIYAEIVGAGYTGDAHHITDMSPGGEGSARALRRALRQADMKPSEIDYINAHGTSTPVGDKNESAAIRSVLGDQADKVAISSSKSMTGHLLGASGAIESIACVMAVHTNKIPPTINYENPDPECDLDYVPNRARKKTVNVAVNNSFGFGGHNATLILKKVTD